MLAEIIETDEWGSFQLCFQASHSGTSLDTVDKVYPQRQLFLPRFELDAIAPALPGASKGSFTQMIFRSDLCACQRPEAAAGKVEQTSSLKKGPAFEGYIDSGDDEEELDLDSDSFPVDRFKPVSELGRGAGGVVYLCRDRLLGKKVAVKVLHVLTAEQLISFQEEARATSRLEHPNIVQIIDFGSTDSGVPFMVLEYFPGRSLLQYLEEFGYMGESDSIEVIGQIMRGLDYAHNKGIYHRDLKPGNILVRGIGEDSPEVKIIDFGLARVSELTGRLTEFQGRTLAGTPFYMSPDVINGHVYTAASEIYSLGCMLFEMLTGSVPFAGESALETLNLHATIEAPRIRDTIDLHVSDHMEDFVARCLHKQPDRRFDSMEEAISALYEAPGIKQSILPNTARPKVARWTLYAVTVAGLAILISLPLRLFRDNHENQKKGSRVSKSTISSLDNFGLIENAIQDTTPVGDGVVFRSAGKSLNLDDLSLKEYLATANRGRTAIEGFRLIYVLDCDIDSLEFFRILGRTPSVTGLTVECSAGKKGLQAAHMDAFLETQSTNEKTRLRSLSIFGSPIDKAVWNRIPRLDGLLTLELQTPDFGDRELSSILNTRIRDLTLAGTAVTEKGLLELTALKTLRSLSISSSVTIRSQTIKTLKGELPYLQEIKVTRIK